MAVPVTIQPLVDKYTFHRDAYLRGQEKYNEIQLRQDFIDPFFTAPGWDVNNNKGSSEAYREVLHDRTLLSRQIAVTNAAIDKMVYELYELTDEEIAIVEGSAK
ncbi:MAG: hypothetical protein NTV84_00935 [Methanoregula sp.]|nr:hypothetical protein [Methanoregula sp.]